jgi:hypothetical protein
MPRGPCAFKQRDVVRALKAIRAAGIENARLEITKDGLLIVMSGKPDEADDSPLDQWRSSRGSR